MIKQETYTVMIGDEDTSEVYKSGLTLERAREIVAACDYARRVNYENGIVLGYTLWISI